MYLSYFYPEEYVTADYVGFVDADTNVYNGSYTADAVRQRSANHSTFKLESVHRSGSKVGSADLMSLSIS